MFANPSAGVAGFGIGLVATLSHPSSQLDRLFQGYHALADGVHGTWRRVVGVNRLLRDVGW